MRAGFRVARLLKGPSCSSSAGCLLRAQKAEMKAAHLPENRELQGAIARSKKRVLFPESAELDRGLTEVGSCVHLKNACSQIDDFRLLDVLENDVERAGYVNAGDALGMHRSKKHLQIWGDALVESTAFTALVTHVLALFDMTLVDCWANLYRHGDDMKSWHHDNYQDRTPRPTVTIGVSFGQARELAFQNVVTKQEFRLLQENGDIFAFDEPFNNVFKHSVPPAPRGAAPGRRLSVILWANEQASVPRIIRKKNPGMPDIVPLEVNWTRWPASSRGHATDREHNRCADITSKLEASLLASQSNDFNPDSPRPQAERFARSCTELAEPVHSIATSCLPHEPLPDDVCRMKELFLRVAAPCRVPAAQRTWTSSEACATFIANSSVAPRVETQSFYGGVGQASNRWHCNAEAATCSPEELGGPEAAVLEKQLLKLAVEDTTLLEVSRALTLQGAQQVLALLRGYKLIENRSWKIPVGWYAIHSGSQMITEERAERLHQVWPDAPGEQSLPHGAIMGLFYVHSHRTPEECKPGYVWAVGPICHIVSKAVEFPNPIRSRGDKGLWSLKAWQLEKIREQLQGEVAIANFDISELTNLG